MSVTTLWITAGLLILLSTCGAVLMAIAEDKPACQDQLMVLKAQAYNLDKDRDTKEEALAKAQIDAYMLGQKVAMLEKQLAELKKAAEPKAKE
jgi:hypothetical protein